MISIGEDVEEQRGSLDVDTVITVDFVHRLSGAGLGREVDYRIDALQGVVEVASFVDVAPDELGSGRQLEAAEVTVNLSRQIIEDAHPMVRSKSEPRQVCADEAGTASDQDMSH
jgi:hypothetical protein